MLGPTRPVEPLVSLRRDLGPLVDAATARGLTDALDQLAASLPSSSCLVVEAEGISVQHRGDLALVPASGHKLLTAVALLAGLGEDTRLTTSLVTTAPVVDGVLQGDLHLLGGADPLLGTAAYATRRPDRPVPHTDVGRLAEAVAAAGVVRIAGAIVVDDTRHDVTRYHPAWPPRYAAQGQVGPASAAAVDDGFVSFPPTAPAPVAAPDPARHAGEVLLAELAVRGVAVSGGVGVGQAPASGPTRRDLATVASRSVGELVRQLLLDSDNGTAEILVRELGLVRLGEPTFEGGARALAQVLAEEAMLPPGTVVVDGSGLATDNRSSCATLLAALDHPRLTPHLPEGLPLAGRTGTLSERFRGTAADGRLRAKTGTLNDVAALVGLVGDPEDPTARFALVINGPAIGAAGPTLAAQARLAELLTAPPPAPDVSALSPRGQRAEPDS